MKLLKDINTRREETLKNYPDLKDILKEIRERDISKITDNIKKAQETLKGKGCEVYYASNQQEVNKILNKLFKDEKQLVRTNSTVLKEIGFDSFLEKQGVKVFKSNVDEIILETLKKEATGHPLFPFLDIKKEEVIQGLKKYLQDGTEKAPKELNKELHQKIKEKILNSNFGVTGVSSVVAENGTLILAENEGNERAVSNLPYRHLVITGIEKITYTVEEAMLISQGTAIYGLGKNCPTYYSLISGPSRTADIEFRMAYGMHGPKEVHVILLDNGRNKLIKKGLGSILKCIDCGGCFESLLEAAKINGWLESTLTPKAIALNIIQGKLQKPQRKINLKPFTCPVGMNEIEVSELLQKI